MGSDGCVTYLAISSRMQPVSCWRMVRPMCFSCLSSECLMALMLLHLKILINQIENSISNCTIELNTFTCRKRWSCIFNHFCIYFACSDKFKARGTLHVFEHIQQWANYNTSSETPIITLPAKSLDAVWSQDSPSKNLLNLLHWRVCGLYKGVSRDT